MNKLIITTLLLVSLVSTSVFSQAGWNWGEQIDVAKENNAIYTDMVKIEKYLDAIAPHAWLLENTPDLNESLYQNGAKIYSGLANKESDKAQKAAYQAKALEMYDLRIEYFGNEASVLNRKAFPAYKFYKGDKSKYVELLDLFEKTFALSGANFSPNNFVAYMDVVRRFKATGGELSDEKVLDIYTGLMDALDGQIAVSSNPASLERVAENVDKLLTLTIDLSCDYVESLLGPKLAETGDIKVASKIFKLMLQNKCTDRPLAFEAAKIVNQNSPDFAISKFLASRASKEDDRQGAIQYYNQALTLTEEVTKKAEIYLSLAKIDYQAGLKGSARSNCRKALSADPSMSDAHVLIGNLYLSSFEECKQGEFKTVDYAIFIAAHNAFQKAGDYGNMKKSEALFPSITDIFTEEYTEGQSIKIDCWINESVILQKRAEN
jgi:tetratricopeptide (TPR) repeat protein